MFNGLNPDDFYMLALEMTDFSNKKESHYALIQLFQLNLIFFFCVC